MSLLLIGATGEKIKEALAAAGVDILAEGGTSDLADYITEHREELSEVAFIFHGRVTRGPGGLDFKWSQAVAALIARAEALRGRAVICWEIKPPGEGNEV